MKHLEIRTVFTMKTNRQTKAFLITLRLQGVSSSLLRLCHNTIIRHRILNSQPNLQLNMASVGFMGI